MPIQLSYPFDPFRSDLAGQFLRLFGCYIRRGFEGVVVVGIVIPRSWV